MPILPPLGQGPQDYLSDILDLVRVRLNDAMQNIGGEVITNIQPFTQVGVNGAWRRFQGLLSSLGYPALIKQEDILALPKATNTDPAAQVNISWTGYYDGQNYFTQPALPMYLIRPLRLWERPSGTTQSFLEMDEIRKGIPAVPQLPWFQMWEWHTNVLIMPGCTTVTDIRVRFQSCFPDFEDEGTTPWYSQPVPIVRAKDAFADYICYEFCHARGDLEAQNFLDQAKEACLQIIKLDDFYDGEGRTQASPAAQPQPAAGAPS